MREILSPGVYTVKIGGDDAQAGLNPPRCASALVKVSVSPTKNAKAKLTDQCLDTNSLGTHLKFG